MLKPPLGSLELQNQGPFPLMPKDPDFSGEGLSSLHGALSPHLLGIDLVSVSYRQPRVKPGEQCGEGNQGLLACPERLQFC